MNQRTKWSAQLVVVLLCTLALKLYYSTASPDQLRWILAPTTALVELLSGRSFEFESYAGYMSSDHTFLIAASCAGVNFMITAFLMLSLRSLFRERLKPLSWRFLPMAALFAYLATVIANTVRICFALRLQKLPNEISSLSRGQLHRLEGILVYFGFLFLLFMLTETTHSKRVSDFVRLARFPLLIYYSTTLAVPLANGAYRQGTEFWEHFVFVLVVPLIFVLPILLFRVTFARRIQRKREFKRCIPPTSAVEKVRKRLKPVVSFVFYTV
jgi:exosortase K